MRIMKKILFFIGFGFVLLSSNGCKDDPAPVPSETQVNGWDTITNFSGLVVPKTGSITIDLAHYFDGSALEFASKYYVNAAGDTFTINDLRYYFTNVTLISPNGDKTNLKNYHLIDAKQASTKTFTIPNVPAGNYTGMTVLLGVDPERNHSGLQEGALDPSWSMFWTWSTGYIFYRINGNVTGGKTYSYDIGGDNNLPTNALDLKSFKVKSSAAKLSIDMNIAEMFKKPTNFSFVTDGLAIHTDTDPAAKKLATNMEDMLTIKSLMP